MSELTPKQAGHTWKFFRAGGFDQVRLDTGADIAALGSLDQKLWVALACPTQGLEFDAKTLELIDTDKDGRIRAPEILAATTWTCAMLRNPDELLKGSDTLPLDTIDIATPEGRQLLSSARQILLNLGKADATLISMDDTADTVKIFAQTKFNGDGIVPADSSDKTDVQTAITEIIACLGSQTDRSGKAGITQAMLDEFFAQLQAYSDWWAAAQADAATVLPLGDATLSAAAALGAVRAKVDDYFARCRVAGYDGRALAALNHDEKDYVPIGEKDLSASAVEVSTFPLALVAPGKPLPLADGVNPAWAAALALFQRAAITPVLGDRSALTEEEWATIGAKFAPYDAWAAAKAGVAVEKLGLPRVRELLAGYMKEAITALIAQDQALEPEANSIAAVDRLVRYNRYLYALLNNYVSFREFYQRRQKAVFQAGTLYLDTRSCDLCVRVEDMARHGLMAHLSCCFLAYCDLTRKATGEKMTIATAFTGGDSDYLIVGRNGVFYDRKGQDWDATVVKIVDNPISIRQAFWSPYKRVMRWIEDQIAKRAAAADATSFNQINTAATSAAAGTPAKPAAPKLDVGIIAALGVAAGFITAALGALLQAFFGLGVWMPLGIIAVVLLISGPSMVIAWLKLRERNLGPILDANGWAVNAKAKINIPFGGSLTRVAALPPGSRLNRHDPFAQSHSGRDIFIAIVLMLAALWASWYFGLIERIRPGLLPESHWAQTHLHREAKANAATQPATATAPAK